MNKQFLLVIVVASCFLVAFSGDKKREVILSGCAPAPIGPYSQAIRHNGVVYVSGQIALTKAGVLDTSSVENECRQVLENIKAILESAGLKMSDVNKASVFTTDLKQFSRINEVYKTYFLNAPPARETVEVRALPKGAHVEISVIAGE